MPAGLSSQANSEFVVGGGVFVFAVRGFNHLQSRGLADFIGALGAIERHDRLASTLDRPQRRGELVRQERARKGACTGGACRRRRKAIWVARKKMGALNVEPSRKCNVSDLVK